MLGFSVFSCPGGVGLPAPTVWLGEVIPVGGSASPVGAIFWIDGGSSVGVGVGDVVGVGELVGVEVKVGVMTGVGVVDGVGEDDERISREYGEIVFVGVGVGQSYGEDRVGYAPLP